MEQKKIKSYKNFSTDNVPHFDIKELATELELTVESLKLTSTISTSNMVLFDTKQRLRKYDSVGDILHEFCHFRYAMYQKRKVHVVASLEKELVMLHNKFRFLTEVMNGTLVIQNVEEEKILATLTKTGYVKGDDSDSFSYLLSMHIRSFSKQRIEELSSKIKSLEEEKQRIMATSEADMWLNDLMEFEKEYEKK